MKNNDEQSCIARGMGECGHSLSHAGRVRET